MYEEGWGSRSCRVATLRTHGAGGSLPARLHRSAPSSVPAGGSQRRRQARGDRSAWAASLQAVAELREVAGRWEAQAQLGLAQAERLKDLLEESATWDPLTAAAAAGGEGEATPAAAAGAGSAAAGEEGGCGWIPKGRGGGLQSSASGHPVARLVETVVAALPLLRRECDSQPHRCRRRAAAGGGRGRLCAAAAGALRQAAARAAAGEGQECTAGLAGGWRGAGADAIDSLEQGSCCTLCWYSHGMAVCGYYFASNLEHLGQRLGQDKEGSGREGGTPAGCALCAGARAVR